jgi:hypothetical protein
VLGSLVPYILTLYFEGHGFFSLLSRFNAESIVSAVEDDGHVLAVGVNIITA